MKIKAIFYLGISVFFIFVQCRNKETIAHIKNNPQRYENKTISISGTVKGYTSVAFGDIWRSFMLDDGSGSMIVRTNRSILPKSGIQVTITGELEQITFIGLILKEK